VPQYDANFGFAALALCRWRNVTRRSARAAPGRSPALADFMLGMQVLAATALRL
jgi:hypothetical protein